MLEFLRSWIINIVTISIILILFEIIVPSGKIKKLISLVSGFVLLIAVVNPFISLKNGDFDLSEKAMNDSFYIDKKEVETSSKLLEETQMKQISSVYKKKIAAKVVEETNKLEGVAESKAEVEIDEDYKSDKYGEITKITVEVKKGKKQMADSDIKPVASVKKIDISLPFIKKENKKNTQTVNSDDKRLSELVRQSLNKSLEVNKDSIVVVLS